jgi:hypothetical protein
VQGALLTEVERVRRETLAEGLTTSGLTGPEVDVLRLMAEGWESAEIAANHGTPNPTSRRYCTVCCRG